MQLFLLYNLSCGNPIIQGIILFMAMLSAVDIFEDAIMPKGGCLKFSRLHTAGGDVTSGCRLVSTIDKPLVDVD